MPSIHRNRTIYGLLTLIILLMGLASRRFLGDIPFVKTYIGDVLWALMVFFGFAFLFTRWPTKAIALATLIFSFSIESSQLYHAPWIDSLRATRLGGLVLGFTFVWSDLLCYSLGVMIGFVAETFLIPGRYQR
ncbi:DUF2809 domain-containing protein [Spirosoma sp. KCTC 42546]|uniref:ribosomal maturation YjgA family protein n=1 Tax=Spirosoma sp. KCTC 42546 TaxID=2520506 RepID=UPI001157EADD|nr:DUF2809 domain-containing protein [Spirosoma sp. KCTC 42546]QDK80415.1 DUF2809 domain-containing protein [Spirosoma sp. KCTC 42546]